MATRSISPTKVEAYSESPLSFVGEMVIPGPSGPIRFDRVWADFQEEMFEAVEPCLLAVAAGHRPEKRGFWLERTKGGSKDSDVGLCLLWLLIFSPRPLLMEAGADDQSQAKETYKAMQVVATLNPWIDARLTFHKSRILCEETGSVLEFLTTDSTGAHGSRPAVTVCNELSHVSNRDFIATMMDNAAKVPNNLTVICTNAGRARSWQHEWREHYRENSRWYFQKLDEPAPWVSPDDIEEARVRNSTSRFNRLWKGIWGSGEGDALDATDITACVVRKGPILVPGHGWVFVSGLDLGVKNDHSALVVLGVQLGSGKVTLAHCERWAPGADGQVDLGAVRQAHRDAWHRYEMVWCGFDPSQAHLMAQDLSRMGVPMAEWPFVGQRLDKMARDLMTTFRNRKIELYPDDGLLDDLYRLNIVERRYGYKLEAVSDERGHADTATALAIALPLALEMTQIESVDAIAARDMEPSDFNPVDGVFLD